MSLKPYYTFYCVTIIPLFILYISLCDYNHTSHISVTPVHNVHTRTIVHGLVDSRQENPVWKLHRVHVLCGQDQLEYFQQIFPPSWEKSADMIQGEGLFTCVLCNMAPGELCITDNILSSGYNARHWVTILEITIICYYECFCLCLLPDTFFLVQLSCVSVFIIYTTLFSSYVFVLFEFDLSVTCVSTKVFQ